MMRRSISLFTGLLIAMSGLAMAGPVKTVAVSAPSAEGPLLAYKNAESNLKASLSTLARYESFDALPTDRDGTQYAPDAALSTRPMRP